MVNAVTDVDVETHWLTKRGLGAGGAAAAAVAGEVVLGIRLGFHHHPAEQAAVLLAFHQQATDEVVGAQLGRSSEERCEEGQKALGGRGGYGSARESTLMHSNRGLHTNVSKAFLTDESTF